jgi:hypothetical protein
MADQCEHTYFVWYHNIFIFTIKWEFVMVRRLKNLWYQTSDTSTPFNLHSNIHLGRQISPAPLVSQKFPYH